MVHERLDPVLFEVLRHRINEIIAEAYYTMTRTSGNAVIAECGDHQEALLDANGDTVLAMGGVVEWTYVLEEAGKYLVQAYEDNPGINDGDQFIFNDSNIACVHQPDIQVLAPIFWEGKRVAWMVTAGHQIDIGGMQPGGMMPKAEEVFQEGLCMPGINICEQGRIRKDIENTLKGMTRQPDLFMLDISAKIAANNASAARLKETIEKYGIDTILAAFREMQDNSERLARAKLRKIPDGTWHVVEYGESMREEEPYLRLELTVTKEGDELTLDFTGSSPQSRGSQNVAMAGTKSCATCSYQQVIAWDIPWNAGAWRPLKWIIPEGTIVNPRFSAPLSYNVPGAVNLIIAGALNICSQMLLASKELEKDAYANIGSGIQAAIFYGLDKAGQFFVTFNLDTACSGMGALAHRDGDEASAYHYTCMPSIANVEGQEELFPLLYLFRQEIIDTGGAGKFRGGVGNALCVIPWDTDSVGIRGLFTGQEPRGTLGLAGGYPSNNSLQMVVRNSNIMEKFKRGETPSDIGEIKGEREVISSYADYSVNPGEAHIQYQTGGGGFGDPIERDPNLVAVDVKLGYVSLEAAKEVYGVVIKPEIFEVDAKGTEQQRQAIIGERLKVGRK